MPSDILPVPPQVPHCTSQKGAGVFELSEAQQAVQTSIRRFARRELRWRARKLDTAPPGTVDWELLRKSCAFGLLSSQLPARYDGTMDRFSAAIALEEIARWD